MYGRLQKVGIWAWGDFASLFCFVLFWDQRTVMLQDLASTVW